MWSPSSPGYTVAHGSGPEGPLRITWLPVPPHLLPVRDLQLSSHPSRLPPSPAIPAQAWLTLSEVWLSGHRLVLRLWQKVNTSLVPLSRASALLRRTWGGTYRRGSTLQAHGELPRPPRPRPTSPLGPAPFLSPHSHPRPPPPTPVALPGLAPFKTPHSRPRPTSSYSSALLPCPCYLCSSCRKPRPQTLLDSTHCFDHALPASALTPHAPHRVPSLLPAGERSHWPHAAWRSH